MQNADKQFDCSKTVECEDGKPIPKKKKLSIPEPTENDLELFYEDLSRTKGKPVILSLIINYNRAHIPAYEAGILPKSLTELQDPEAMMMTYSI